MNDAVGTGGDVGIWRESYLVGPGQAEGIYVNMPHFGTGAAGTLHEARGERAAAAKRLAAAGAPPPA